MPENHYLVPQVRLCIPVDLLADCGYQFPVPQGSQLAALKKGRDLKIAAELVQQLLQVQLVEQVTELGMNLQCGGQAKEQRWELAHHHCLQVQ